MSEKEHKKLQKAVQAGNKKRAGAAKGKQVSGKGDKTRPGDLEKYRDNFEKIFGNKEMTDLLNKPGMEKIVEEERELIQHHRVVKVIKKYTDNNNIVKYVVNVNDSRTNRILSEAEYLALTNECNRNDTIDITPEDDSETSFPTGNDAEFGTSME